MSFYYKYEGKPIFVGPYVYPFRRIYLSSSISSANKAYLLRVKQVLTRLFFLLSKIQKDRQHLKKIPLHRACSLNIVFASKTVEGSLFYSLLRMKKYDELPSLSWHTKINHSYTFVIQREKALIFSQCFFPVDYQGLGMLFLPSFFPVIT